MRGCVFHLVGKVETHNSRTANRSVGEVGRGFVLGPLSKHRRMKLTKFVVGCTVVAFVLLLLMKLLHKREPTPICCGKPMTDLLFEGRFSESEDQHAVWKCDVCMRTQ